MKNDLTSVCLSVPGTGENKKQLLSIKKSLETTPLAKVVEALSQVLSHRSENLNLADLLITHIEEQEKKSRDVLKKVLDEKIVISKEVVDKNWTDDLKKIFITKEIYQWSEENKAYLPLHIARFISPDLVSSPSPQFLAIVKKLFKLVPFETVPLFEKDKVTLKTPFYDCADEVRNLIKAKLLDSKQYVCYPYFQNNTQMDNYFRIKMTQEYQNKVSQEERQQLIGSIPSISSQGYSKDFIQYLTLLEDCREQALNMLNDPGLKKENKKLLISNFIRTDLDPFYKKLREEKSIDPENLFKKIIEVRQKLQELQKKEGSIFGGLSKGEMLFDEYFGDNFFRYYRADYLGGKGANILNPKLFIITKDSLEKEDAKYDDKDWENLEKSDDLPVGDDIFFMTGPPTLPGHHAKNIQLEEIKENKEQLKDLSKNDIVQDLRLNFLSTSLTREKTVGTELTFLSTISAQSLRDFTSENDLLNFCQNNMSVISQFLQEAKLRNGEKQSDQSDQKSLIDTGISGKTYVELVQLDAKNGAESNKARRADVFNLVAKLYSFKNGFSKDNIDSDQSQVLKKISQFQYDTHGILNTTGMEQLANLVMARIIHHKNNPIAFQFTINTYQIFKDNVGDKFPEVVKQVNRLNAMYLERAEKIHFGDVNWISNTENLINELRSYM